MEPGGSDPLLGFGGSVGVQFELTAPASTAFGGVTATGISDLQDPAHEAEREPAGAKSPVEMRRRYNTGRTSATFGDRRT